VTHPGQVDAIGGVGASSGAMAPTSGGPRDRPGSNAGQWPDAVGSWARRCSGSSNGCPSCGGCHARPRERPRLAVRQPGRGAVRATYRWLPD